MILLNATSAFMKGFTKTFIGHMNKLSRPHLGEYWFRISLYVYDRNRLLAPILRKRRCSLMYDVFYLLGDDG